jgi:tripartite-type tricarboxylate transporter receptor subunit TctC
MKFPRRRILQLATGAAALPAVSRIARAQAYPTRPVRILVGGPPGGAFDILARLVGQWMSERLGQPFVVENRPGAGTNIATEAVVKAAPDAYTLLVFDASPAINTNLYNNLNFVFLRDIAPVASIVRSPLIMVINPTVPAKTVPEFIVYAKANPGKINMASTGNGATPHVTGELFKIMAGVDMVHVPYRGAAPAITDLLSGQVQVLFISPLVSIEHIKARRLRGLAVTSEIRWQELPDMPTVGDFVPGFKASQWFGVGVPKDTPAAIVDKLNVEINASLADPKMKARLADLGGTVLPGSPGEFGKFIADETEKWGKVIRAANILAWPSTRCSGARSCVGGN